MGVSGQCHTPAALPLGKTRYPLYRRLGGPQGRPGWVQKISSPPGFDPRTVQPVANCYTDCNPVIREYWNRGDPYTYDLIDSWLTVAECANGRQTLIFHKCSAVDWGFVPENPLPSINIPVCHDNIWKYTSTVYAFTSIWFVSFHCDDNNKEKERCHLAQLRVIMCMGKFMTCTHFSVLVQGMDPIAVPNLRMVLPVTLVV
jgi:hypothetical protein